MHASRISACFALKGLLSIKENLYESIYYRDQGKGWATRVLLPLLIETSLNHLTRVKINLLHQMIPHHNSIKSGHEYFVSTNSVWRALDIVSYYNVSQH